MNRRLIEALRAFNRSQKRQRFVEDEKHTDETRRRSCEMCKATEDDVQAKHCRMCGQKLDDVEGYSDEGEDANFVSPFPGSMKSPNSASEDDDETEDEDEKRLRGGYGMRTDERGARRGARADEAIKTFDRTYKRLRG